MSTTGQQIRPVPGQQLQERAPGTAGRRFVTAVTALAGTVMVVTAGTGLGRAAGALGLGVALLLALTWRDAPAVALAGFLVAGTVQAVAAGTGRPGWALALAALSLAAAGALAVRLRRLGYVVGEVGTASAPALAPFVRQKTILLTSYRRNGTPVGTPVSIAVDGDRAFVRSFEKAWKTRRIAGNPLVTIAPSTAKGRATGPAVPARARRLDGAESARAARLLARKHPLLHGVLVPLAHRLGRSKSGRTVHFELTPAP